MLGKFTNYIENKAGALAPLTAVALPLLLGVTAFGVDVGMWMGSHRNLQGAVDAAAIAGAWERAYGFEESDAYEAALKEAVNNGYQDVSGNDLQLTYGTDADDYETVTVVLSAAENRLFADLVSQKDVYNVVTAAAMILPPSDDFCMLSLAPEGTSMVFDGNITLESVGCGLAVNSDDPNAALNLNGSSSDITVGDVSVVGGIDGEEQINATSISTGVPPFTDPYANLSIPAFGGCTEAQQNAGPVQADSMGDLPPPDGDGVRVLCGGLLVKNGDSLDLNAGIYIMDGGDINIKGTLTGEGVTIILTNSGGSSYGEYGDIQFSGDVDISAPLPGALDPDWADFEGMAIYQDRNAPSQVQCNDLKGSASTSVLVDGAMYMPSRCLDIGGNSHVDGGDSCSRIIALTVKIHGDPNMSNNCEGKGVEDINGGVPIVRLIL